MTKDKPKDEGSVSFIDVAVIGAGYSGISVSYYLKQRGLRHLVFERGKIGESWRSQRWDSFVMNTANKLNVLPGQTYYGNAPNGFGTGAEFVSSLTKFALQNHLPIVEQAKVFSITKQGGERYFAVSVSDNESIKKFQAKQVVVASGSQNEKRIPSFAKNIPSNILQLHSGEFRISSQLPEGAVLVVGSGQSGCQIAEELAENGRNVFLSTSMVARLPRRYRGKDIIDWYEMMNFYDLTPETLSDPEIHDMKVPLLSGIGEFGHTLSYQLISQKGVIILGKLEKVSAQDLSFSPDASEHIKFADAFSQKAKALVDEFIMKSQILAPGAEEDLADVPDSEASCASSITSLNLKEHNITSIIWSTGFNGDFSYLKIPGALDIDGNPKHKNGMSEIKGLYYLGLPWLRTRKSSLIFGICDDAEFIAELIVNDLR